MAASIGIHKMPIVTLWSVFKIYQSTILKQQILLQHISCLVNYVIYYGMALFII